ncbi:hypothetical protein CONPUDRAFT_163144 [Coniophora puteana RWD-64-598 SS2]|uniref:Class I glutamine amidotransferase-like protein n=1 Tax=Coniophora puteana (strain RWD-64-598) TaxID=741705 RepID=A0A5M3MXP1_CONPW|nr:uncharacterized protein CONPUDRAFT_163144 [Coniophora puteana RWD-64-598 SS2]EIW83878.1 hypothetical protein CONPUDRAFT_163144 [Coniophora puteana RWD-64-598 SS2]
MAITAPAPTPAPRILVVNCDQTKPDFVKEFGDVVHLFRDVFTGYVKDEPSAAHPAPGGDTTNGWEMCSNGAFYFKGFDATKYRQNSHGHDVWPHVAAEKIDCIVVGGSSNSVNDLVQKDPEGTLFWMKALAFWLTVTAIQSHHIKFIGICFGHQLLSHVLYDTKITPSTQPEIGPTSVALDDKFKHIFPGGDQLNIQMFHYEMAEPLRRALDEVRDEMTKKQRMFKHYCWGRTPDCGNEGSVVFYDESEEKQIRILTLQGHPELTEAMTRRLIELFSAKGNKLEGVSASDAAEANRKLDAFNADKKQLHSTRAAAAMWKVATGVNFE